MFGLLLGLKSLGDMKLRGRGVLIGGRITNTILYAHPKHEDYGYRFGAVSIATLLGPEAKWNERHRFDEIPHKTIVKLLLWN